MIQFAVATKPAPLKNKSLLWVSYALALGTTGIAVAQMASFEDFVTALRSYQVFGQRGTLAFAVVLLGFEIFSVPFLLRLNLSRAARWCSALLVLFTPLTWLALSAHALLGNWAVSNAGYFGGLVHVPLGTMVLLLDGAWAAVAIFSFGPLGGARALRGK